MTRARTTTIEASQLRARGSSEKLLSLYTGITPKVVKRYIGLDHSAALESFAESHLFFKPPESGESHEKSSEENKS